jgi:predicted dehydrogenase
MTSEIKVGIIGTGIISEFHALAYRNLSGVRVEAVCDVNKALAEQRAREWGARKVYTNYLDLLNDPEITAVEVLLPHHLHKEVVIAAAEHGKQVSVQKPMALTPSDASDMIQAARRANVILNVAENILFHQSVSKAMELIRSGELGKPFVVLIERVPGVGTLEKFKEPRYPGYWRMSKEKSGGMVFDDMVHYDPLSRFLMQSDIEFVSATLDQPRASFEVPALISWKHREDSKYSSLVYSAATKIQMPTNYAALHESVEVICEEGLLRMPNLSAKLTNDAPLIVYKNGQWQEFSELSSDYSNSFRREIGHFVDCIRTGSKPIFGGEEGLKQVLFATAIQKSAEESRIVRLAEVAG